MTRGQKKFLYGLFYLVVVVFLVWMFIPSSNAPMPPAPVTGGPVANQPLPLQVSGVPRAFVSSAARRVVMLGQVTNPNPDYGAGQFSYEFLVFDRSGGTVATVPGTDFIHPSEVKYVLGIYDAGGGDLSRLAARPGFRLTNADFAPAANFLDSDVALIGRPSTEVASSSVVVSGSIKNGSSFPVSRVRVIAVLENKYGDPIFAAQTLISGLAGSGESPFEVRFPDDDFIVQNAGSGKTEVFLSGE